MRKLAFTLILLTCSLALAQSVYKWTDENGVVHYSDQPHPNAEKVHVKAIQTYKAGAGDPVGSSASGPSGTSPASREPAYQGCAVVTPSDGAEFANLPSLNISVQTDPALHPGDQIYVSLDGQPLNDGKPTGPQFALSPVDRGTHSLQAQIRDSDGTIVCQTPSVTFNVHQASVQNPASPIRPH